MKWRLRWDFPSKDYVGTVEKFIVSEVMSKSGRRWVTDEWFQSLWELHDRIVDCESGMEICDPEWLVAANEFWEKEGKNA